MIIDTHAHLNNPDLVGNISEILSRAEDAGLKYIIIPATDYRSSVEITELVSKHKMLYGAVGIHPTELTDFNESDLNEIEILASEDKIIAIGETGLDYYWKPYDKDLQKYVLEAQLQIAKSKNLPVILHNRNSSEELIRIISEHSKDRKLKAQFHSFSGNISMANECIKMGHYISFTGNITYKPKHDSVSIIDIVKAIPPENLLLETDSPYLSPLPFRGKINEPSYIRFTMNKIAEIKQLPAQEIENKTYTNTLNFFSLADK